MQFCEYWYTLYVWKESKGIKRNQIYIKIKHNSIDIKTKQWYSTSEKIFEIPYWWYWFKILMSNLKIYIRNMVNFLQIFLCMILQFTDRLRKQTRRRKNILSFFKFPKGGFWKLFSLFFFFLLSFFSHSLTSFVKFFNPTTRRTMTISNDVLFKMK